MKVKTKKKPPGIVIRDSKPVAVILHIAEYQEILERLEDVEDLRMLQAMKKRPLHFRKLNEYLKEYNAVV